MEDSNNISSEKLADAAMKFADAVTSAEKSQLKLQAATNHQLVDMKDSLQHIVDRRNDDDDDNNNNNDQVLIKAVEDLIKESQSIHQSLDQVKEDTQSTMKSVQWLKTISRSIKNLQEDAKTQAEKDTKIHAIEFAIQNVDLVWQGSDDYLVKYSKGPKSFTINNIGSRSGKSVLIDILLSFRQGRGHYVGDYFLDPPYQNQDHYWVNDDDILDEKYENFQTAFHKKLHKLLGKEPTLLLSQKIRCSITKNWSRPSTKRGEGRLKPVGPQKRQRKVILSMRRCLGFRDSLACDQFVKC